MTAPTTIETPTAGKRTVKPRRYDKREVRAAYAFLAPWIIGFLIFTLGAMIYSLVISFSHYQLATNTARPAGFSNYELLFEDPKVFISILTWVVYSFAVLARRTLGWTGRRAAWLSASGFAMVLLNFIAVSYLFETSHTFQ